VSDDPAASLPVSVEELLRALVVELRKVIAAQERQFAV